jgi:4-oxalmesaconate hydratase
LNIALKYVDPGGKNLREGSEGGGMIIDAHAHLVAPPSLYAYRSTLIVSGGQHGAALAAIPDDDLRKSADSNVKLMDEVGTDIQFISPRPFMQIHRGRFTDSQLWARSNNEQIAKTVKFHPTRFRGVAGIPQCSGLPIDTTFGEIDYAINELGFIGILLNPDPGEGLDQTPTLNDPYWYPLYEKAIAMKIPLHVHSGGCCGRETYDEHFVSEESLAITSIARSDVFDRFPKLKLMISHGGGSIPYQVGRWRSNRVMSIAKDSSGSGFEFRGKGSEVTTKLTGKPVKSEFFDDTLKRFSFDTCIHYKPSLELLFGLVGSERCLFGTENPGSGSGIDPETKRPYDDLKPVIESIPSLSAQDKKNIFEDNAKKWWGSRLKLPQAVGAK